MRWNPETRRVSPRARLIAAACIVMLAGLQACSVVRYRPEVVIGTGSAGGVAFALGDSVCRVFNLDHSERGLRCAAFPSRGPLANIESLHAGSIDIGIVQSDVLADAIAGRGPFASRGGHGALRVLLSGQTEAFTIVARGELKIRAATQLRGTRINLGSPGSGERASMERVMAALGFTPGDFAAARELPLAQQHDAFCANELDAIVYMVRHPNGLVDDVIRTCGGVLLDVSGPPIERLLASHSEYSRTAIRAKTYPGNPQPLATIGVRTAIIATTRLPDTVAYEITKAVIEHADDFMRLHPDFATLAPRDMVPVVANVPVHEGAVRYYRARGWLPP